MNDEHVEALEVSIDLVDEQPGVQALRREVLAGLSLDQKTLPPKLLYDETGARLFEDICETQDYYVTRTEFSIMHEHVGDMARRIGPRCRLVEYGSGASTKTRMLLEHLETPAGYVPIDIAKEQLVETASALAMDFPNLPVAPVCADFTSEFTLPEEPDEAVRSVVYCPGSTIGNFHPPEAGRMLQHAATVTGHQGGVLMGVDLIKPRDVLERAYNDSEGVTAAFNLNLLERLNRELNADFDLTRFRHRAHFNEAKSRVEMHLESLEAQQVRVGGATISFEAGETIHTECSYKYRLEQFQELARRAGLTVQEVWTDPRAYFSIQFLGVGAGG